MVQFKHFFREILAPRCYASVPLGRARVIRGRCSLLFLFNSWPFFFIFWCLPSNFRPFLSFFCVFWVIFEPVFAYFLRVWSNLCTFLWTHLCLWKLSQRLFSDVRPCLILTIQHHLICHIIKLCNQRNRHLNNEKLFCYNNMLYNNILHLISCSYTTTKSYVFILTHKDVCHQHYFLQQKHPELTDKTFF